MVGETADQRGCHPLVIKDIQPLREFKIRVKNHGFLFVYIEIEEWFQMGKSQKGSDRGIGLYHLKCLCMELAYNVSCKNITIEDKNWIEFGLKVKKSGDNLT